MIDFTTITSLTFSEFNHHKVSHFQAKNIFINKSLTVGPFTKPFYILSKYIMYSLYYNIDLYHCWYGENTFKKRFNFK